MLKRNETRRFLVFIASIVLILSLSGDFLRGKPWAIGPLQNLGCGIATGIFISSFLILRKGHRTKKKIFTTGLVFLFIDVFICLAIMMAGYDIWNVAIIMGMLAGASFAYLCCGFLLCIKISGSQLMEIVLFSSIVAPFFFLLIIRYIRLDFWYDEVYSLNSFILVPLAKTMTDYHAPNNHIFFNILSNLFLKTIGQQDIYRLVDIPWLLRVVSLFYGLLAIVFLYLAVKKKTNRLVALFTLIIFTTTIPFYNFAVQIRGYVLSILLVCMLLYYLWQYEASGSKKAASSIVVLSGLILYTIPTNAYFLASIGLYYSLRAVRQIRRPDAHDATASRRSIYSLTDVSFLAQIKEFNIAMLMVAGALVAFLFYIPVLDQLLNNPLAKHAGYFPLQVFYPKMVKFFNFVLSGRYLLLVTAIAGLSALLVSTRTFRPNKKKGGLQSQPSQPLIHRIPASLQSLHQDEERFFKQAPHINDKELASLLLFSVISILMPFVFSFLHGYDPYYRVFLFVTPITAFFLALCSYRFFQAVPKFTGKSLAFIIILFIYCNLTFISELAVRDHHLLSDIQSEQTSQDIMNNYYQAYYHPARIIKEFAQKNEQEYVPVFVNQWGDTQSIPLYTAKYIKSHTILNRLEDIVSDERHQFYVITIYPNRFIDETRAMSPNLSCRSLTDTSDYLDVLFCECVPDDMRGTSCPPVQATTP